MNNIELLASNHPTDEQSALISSIVRRAVLECAGRNVRPETPCADPFELFRSPRVKALREEIVRAGQKLWQRQYVDGNGGNISARVSDEYVLCTPTLLSKGDLRVEDLALVDLDNRRICGDLPHTSELLLHLEIYKAVPEAKAVIHCHPPYATAHAVAGVVPRGNLVPEQEIFIGKVGLSPYETPGTQAFAETIRPLAKTHNAILLANHGIVCWADTVTHAEWYAEIIETYCKTVQIAQQLRPDLPEIPPDKMAELVAIRKKVGLGLPSQSESTDRLESRGETKTDGNGHKPGQCAESPLSEKDRQDAANLDRLVSSLTNQVIAFLKHTA